MNDIDRTQKETKEVEKENHQYQRNVNILQGGLQKIFDILSIKEDGIWDTDALTHKRGYALHKIGMLEYRAFELTQAKLDMLASQHNPQSLLNKGMGKERFEAPDLLLPSMQKPQANI